MADPEMLFDLNVSAADIHDALNDFFRQAGRAFVIDDDALTGTVTVHAADLGFDDALHLLLPTDYAVGEIGGVYHIRRLPRAA